MGRWNRYTKWWLLWGAAFLVIETSAVRHRRRLPGGTLSSLVWRFIATEHPVRRWAFLIGWLLLSSHFFFRWPDF